MRTRILTIIMLVILALSVAAFAENPQGMGKQGGPGMGIGRQLNLTPEQSKAIRDIVTKFRTDARDVYKSDLPKDQKVANIKSLRASAGTAILNLLTPEQRTKAEQIKFVDRILSPQGAAKRIMRVLAKLDLTSAQKDAVKGIMKSQHEKALAVRQDTTLTPEAKQAKLRDIHQETISLIRAQLTAEQQTKFDELMKNRGKTAAGEGAFKGGAKRQAGATR